MSAGRRTVIIPAGVPLTDAEAMAYVNQQLAMRGFLPRLSGARGRPVTATIRWANASGDAPVVGKLCVLDPRIPVKRRNLTRERLNTSAWVSRRLAGQVKLAHKFARMNARLLPKKPSCKCKAVTKTTCRKK